MMAKAINYNRLSESVCVTFLLLISRALSVLSWKYTVWHISSLFVYPKNSSSFIEIKHLGPYSSSTTRSATLAPTKMGKPAPARHVRCHSTYPSADRVGGGRRLSFCLYFNFIK
mgnify:CR=1 FL=1